MTNNELLHVTNKINDAGGVDSVNDEGRWVMVSDLRTWTAMLALFVDPFPTSGGKSGWGVTRRAVDTAQRLTPTPALPRRGGG